MLLDAGWTIQNFRELNFAAGIVRPQLGLKSSPPNACRGERCRVWGRIAPIRPVQAIVGKGSSGFPERQQQNSELSDNSNNGPLLGLSGAVLGEPQSVVAQRCSSRRPRASTLRPYAARCRRESHGLKQANASSRRIAAWSLATAAVASAASICAILAHVLH
jgi:hypothetical protein